MGPRLIVVAVLLLAVSSAQIVTRVIQRSFVLGATPRIATDSAGASIVASTTSRVVVLHPDPIHTQYVNHYDTQITRLSAEGVTTALTSFLDTTPTGLVIGANGNLYVCIRDGSMFSGSVAKLTPAGEVAWRYSIAAAPNSLALDRDGAIWIAGAATSSFQPTPDAFQAKNGYQQCPSLVYDGRPNCTDAFVAKLSSDGSKLVYATFLGGGRDDSASAIAVDDDGNIWVAGASESGDFPTTSNAYQTSFGGPSTQPGYSDGSRGDGFLAKFDGTIGGLLYSTYLGGSGADSVPALAIAPGDGVFIVGSTGSADFPVTQNAARKECFTTRSSTPSCSSAFYAMFSSSGLARYVSYHDSVGASGVAAGRDGTMWIAVATQLSFPTSCSPLSALITVDPATGGVLQREPLMYVASPAVALDDAGIVHTAGNRSNALAISFGHTSGSGSTIVQLLDFSRSDEFEPQCLMNLVNFIAGSDGLPMYVAPGEIISIVGLGLGPSARVWLGGRELTILSSTSSNILAAIPSDLPSGPSHPDATPLAMKIERGSYSASYTVYAGPAFPAILTNDGRHAAVLNQDGTINSVEHPAARGSIISVFATGLGALDDQGQIARPYQLYVEASTPSNASGMEILYGGLAPGLPGVY